MTKTDAPMHVESTTYHGQVHGDKPFNADEWLQKAGAAFDHATLCSKLSGGTFASAHEWWEAREVASTAEQVVVATLVAAHGRLLAAEKLAGAHVDTRGPAAPISRAPGATCGLCNNVERCQARGRCAEFLLPLDPPAPGSPVDAVRTLKALGYSWVHGQWRCSDHRSPNTTTVDLLEKLRTFCEDAGAKTLAADARTESLRLQGGMAPPTNVLDQPLGVTVKVGSTVFGSATPVRNVVEYAEEQHNRAKRLTKAAEDMLCAGGETFGDARYAALRKAVQS